VRDRSTRTLFDVRVVRAYRLAGPAAVIAWDAIVDASWEAGERVPLADALDSLPYQLGDAEELGAALRRVGLLDSDGLIRAEAWADWYGTAAARREASRERAARWRSRGRDGGAPAPGRGLRDAIREVIGPDGSRTYELAEPVQ
jgi:hypothetical protein